MKTPFARKLYGIWIKNFTDTDAFDRSVVRLILSFTILGSIISVAYFIIHPLVLLNVPRYVFLLLPVLLNSFCLLLITRTHIHTIAQGIIASYWVCFMLGTYYSGGIQSLVLPWLSLMPVMANLLLDYKRSVIWFGIILVSVTMFVLFTDRLPAVRYTDDQWRYVLSIIGLCLVLFLFTSLFDKARYRILQILKVKNEDLARQKDAINIINHQLEEKIEEINTRNNQLEKHWNTLIDVSKDKSINFGTLEEALNYIASVTASSLHVSRVSVWLYEREEKERIECISAYSLLERKYYSTSFLSRDDNQPYFEAIKKERVIAASDARQHVATRGFTANYLNSLNIYSLLDAPFFLDGKLAGILCCEHQEVQREWTAEDIIFVTSMADIVSLAFRSATRRMYEKQLREMSKEIQKQNELLKKQAEEVAKVNEDLELHVQNRTQELMKKNQQLAEYAFINSHLLRGPLSRILGLVNLFSYTDSRAEEELIERLRHSSQELDDVVARINKAIEEDSFNKQEPGPKT